MQRQCSDVLVFQRGDDVLVRINRGAYHGNQYYQVYRSRLDFQCVIRRYKDKESSPCIREHVIFVRLHIEAWSAEKYNFYTAKTLPFIEDMLSRVIVRNSDALKRETSSYRSRNVVRVTENGSNSSKQFCLGEYGRVQKCRGRLSWTLSGYFQVPHRLEIPPITPPPPPGEEFRVTVGWKRQLEQGQSAGRFYPVAVVAPRPA